MTRCCGNVLCGFFKEASSGLRVAAAALQEYTAKLGALQAKGDDYEIAAAQIGVEVYSAMSAAVGA